MRAANQDRGLAAKRAADKMRQTHLGATSVGTGRGAQGSGSGLQCMKFSWEAPRMPVRQLWQGPVSHCILPIGGLQVPSYCHEYQHTGRQGPVAMTEVGHIRACGGGCRRQHCRSRRHCWCCLWSFLQEIPPPCLYSNMKCCDTWHLARFQKSGRMTLSGLTGSGAGAGAGAITVWSKSSSRASRTYSFFRYWTQAGHCDGSVNPISCILSSVGVLSSSGQQDGLPQCVDAEMTHKGEACILL